MGRKNYKYLNIKKIKIKIKNRKDYINLNSLNLKSKFFN